MVSRAGRSKGCSNCRKRRIKCDESRPVCNRCKKRNLVCEGPKDSTWINHHNDLSLAGHLHNTIPEELSFVAFEDDICVSYTRKHLIRGGCVEIACDLVQRVGLSGNELEPGLDLLRNAILSLSAAFYGNQHRQGFITNRGYKTYGKVLGQLNAHLAQPHLQTTDETILTAVTCMILEIFIPTGPNNFFKHVRGIEAIIAARGPPTSPTGANPAMLSGVRILCIIGALAQQRSSIWATVEWKRVPSPHRDEGSLIRHEMLLILADCTAIMERTKKVSPNMVPSENRSEVMASARECMSRLKALYPRWERHNESMIVEETSPATKEPNIANHSSATTYMLYNAALICVLRIMNAYATSAENGSLEVAAALRIVRCLELWAHEKREGSGESNTIKFIATKLAWETLGGFDSPGGRRLSRAVKAGANGVFATGAWEELKEPTELSTIAHSQADIGTMASSVQSGQASLPVSTYTKVPRINTGERSPHNMLTNEGPFPVSSEPVPFLGTVGSPSQIFVA